MSFTVLVAPSGFKESLSADQAADCIENGVLRAFPGVTVIKAPMVDGGEGFTKALVKATGGVLHQMTVTGPVNEPVEAHFGFLGGSGELTAVIEMAAAAGLSLVPRDRRNPCLTTSYGVGELVRAALDQGARRILLGCGDSGINDGGAGMAEALGIRLLDGKGNLLPRGGAALAHLTAIDMSGRDPRLEGVRIDAAVNWHNVLLGERGVARVFGPQKGATPAQVEMLVAAMETYAAEIRRTTGIEVGMAPGCGASGGLGAAVSGLLGGELHPRYDIVMQYLELDRFMAKADLVITAEGSLDGQTPFGKVPAEVAARAKTAGVPVIALAGTIGKGVRLNFEHGIDAFASILSRPCSLEDAIFSAPKLLSRAAEDAARMVLVGMRLGARSRFTSEHRRPEAANGGVKTGHAAVQCATIRM
ncbi:glycerate kinase [Neorhizobium galegae]|uniref:glycerate kinase family protein n=1 Tax=Neorhizobium galegae TaxID=399 RepID=UPI00062120C7|nr:glycerate kinase [Neorhizobium galegae]CDZ29093.1 Glycerate kinase [Neorhizobium galegae bv. officinalis]KAB1115037.1 glycerate kinase [Neorhizobium galegae]MCQ1774423.1 glycerate kinase [Neorhizobium galegae]MCQ1775615.1 glycerate kinase [Neorhizobium galegae]MCQ1798117.1 glycerate kinase [Neorhizobium galegae]